MILLLNTICNIWTPLINIVLTVQISTLEKNSPDKRQELLESLQNKINQNLLHEITKEEVSKCHHALSQFFKELGIRSVHKIEMVERVQLQFEEVNSRLMAMRGELLNQNSQVLEKKQQATEELERKSNATYNLSKIILKLQREFVGKKKEFSDTIQILRKRYRIQNSRVQNIAKRVIYNVLFRKGLEKSNDSIEHELADKFADEESKVLQSMTNIRKDLKEYLENAIRSFEEGL